MMTSKISLLVAGAALGAGLATATMQSGPAVFDERRRGLPDTYRNLSLFGDIFEKIRTDYVEKPTRRS